MLAEPAPDMNPYQAGYNPFLLRLRNEKRCTDATRGSLSPDRHSCIVPILLFFAGSSGRGGAQSTCCFSLKRVLFHGKPLYDRRHIRFGDVARAFLSALVVSPERVWPDPEGAGSPVY